MKILLVIMALLLTGPAWAWEQQPTWQQPPTYTPGGQPVIPGSPYGVSGYIYTPDGGMAIKTPGSPYAIPLDDGYRGPRRGREHEQPAYGQPE